MGLWRVDASLGLSRVDMVVVFLMQTAHRAHTRQPAGLQPRSKFALQTMMTALMMAPLMMAPLMMAPLMMVAPPRATETIAIIGSIITAR